MPELTTACSRCGAHITPDDRPVRVVDEFGSNIRHELCAVELLEIPGITIVVPRPVAVTA